MGDWFQDQAAAGSLALALPVAMIAGLVSFFSPCVIPLLPGYLSYATGISGADLAAGEASNRRGRMLLGSVLFVLGFTVVFVLIGTALGGIGVSVRQYEDQIRIGMGIVLVVLGLVFAGAVPWLQREWRIHRVPAVGLGAAPLLGALFAFGWAPCIGPTFGVILTLTYSTDGATAARGGVLSAAYALGLGIPFIVVGLFYARSLRALSWVRKHQRAVMQIGGAMLVVIGVLFLTGWWEWAVQWVQVRLVGGFQVPV
ncbi:cytochrome c biogenesis protein CcdA [Nocardioides dongxiaopingii]|jgi:cytochrome c-type biogenesis protein|uniref:cytochrome c biogenesis CcdA family protein n=1 Tax=Nocardioides TaxID=1839 RepID=UPI0010C76A32|nr:MULTISPECIES: cytochrome c biogenesis protein CcdA [Nocardioides]QCW49721.2 cytochrome c biogenesis protein CcdA [Nocardioides sp. S-1144]